MPRTNIGRTIRRYRRMAPGPVTIAGVAIVLAFVLVTLLVVSGSENTALRTGIWVQSLATVGTLALVLLTLATVRTTEHQVSEAREARLAQSRPQVLVSFEQEGDDLFLQIGHYGGGPARNVQFRFEPPLKNEDGKDIGAEPPFSTGIALVPPSYRKRVRFGQLNEYQRN